MNAIVRNALLSAAILCCANLLHAAESEAPRDANGRVILQGPVESGIYSQVHIVSESVGVFAILPTTIVDSEIEAPVCVSTSSRNLTLRGNVLNCAAMCSTARQCAQLRAVYRIHRRLPARHHHRRQPMHGPRHESP